MKKVVFSCAILAMGTTAMAQSWSEVGDAGNFPGVGGAQATMGVGALTTISGNTGTAGGDLEDAYMINIVNPAAFIATTDVVFNGAAFADFDTRLWLFDMAGNVVMGNDDVDGAAGSTFKSFISDPALYAGTGGVSAAAPPGTIVAGNYVLIIAGFSHDPEDAANVDLANLGEFDSLVGPNPLSSGVFDHWEAFAPESGRYTIALDGVEYSTVPAPGALALIGLGGLVATRRRRI
jgi:MYXO-CTERM domain-containing protein